MLEKKHYNQKGSALAATLIILGIILTTSISIALVSARERRSAVSSGKSSVSYQAADQGVEITLGALLKSQKNTIKEINSEPNGWGPGATCQGEYIESASEYDYKVYLLGEPDNGNDVIIECNEDRPITDVKYLKSLSRSEEARGAQRAVKASIPNVNQYTKLLLHMDGDGDVDNSDNPVVDSGSSDTPHKVNKEGTGDLTFDDSVKKFSDGASVKFDGSTYLEVDDEGTDDFNFEDKDFAIDWWENRTDATEKMATFQWSDDNNELSYTGGYREGSNLYFLIYKNNSVDKKVSIGEAGSTGDWHHYAIVRHEDKIYTYRDGDIKNGSGDSFNGGIEEVDGNFLIGRKTDGGNIDYKGYIDEFRISKGIARNADDLGKFPVPDKPYAAD